MNDIMLYSLIVLCALGVIFALILYFVAQKFKVVEDPRIDEISSLLPGANCGGCGFAGCRALAEFMVKTESFEAKCPSLKDDDLAKIAKILGIEAAASDPKIAVVRCNGSVAHAPKKVRYDAASTCFYANSLFGGESGCPNGCLGLGDCISACQFDAIALNPVSGMPEVKDNCVGCGACVKTCPRGVIELRKRGPKDRRIWVSCVNTEKGAVAKKNCSVACIGCMKCTKVCAFEAVTVTNNLAYIDFTKCKLCRKCVAECPTGAIHELNFPPRKPEEPKPVSEKVAEKPVEKIVVEPKTTEQ